MFHRRAWDFKAHFHGARLVDYFFRSQEEPGSYVKPFECLFCVSNHFRYQKSLSVQENQILKGKVQIQTQI